MRFIILITYLSLVSCNSYKQFENSDKICRYVDKFYSISNQEKKLSKEVFSQLEQKKQVTIIKKKLEEEYSFLNNGDVFRLITNKSINIIKSIHYKNKYIYQIEFTYSNGNLPIGKETYFDEQGNITKVIDHEKGYKICWAEMIAIMKKRYRSLIRKYEIHTFNLSRVNLNDFPEAKPRWTVTMEGNEAYEQKGYDEGQKHYSFDGVTGKYLYTSTSISVYD